MVDWANAYKTERQAAEIFAEQERVGWFFDKERAEWHVNFLTNELERLYEEIRPHLTYNVKQISKTPINKPFKKLDGTPSATLVKYCDNVGLPVDVVGGPFSRIAFEEPSLSSAAQVKEQLYRLGWKPTVYNYKKKGKKLVYGPDGDPIKTSPKLTEDSYDSLQEGIGPNLKKWMIYSHRLTNFEGWLRDLRPDGTIPSVVDGCGTPTARVRHRVIANVPNEDSLYGPESREVFIPRPGRLLVGEDQAQIEARLIANVSIIILGHTKLADAIMGRDFHQVIFEALDGLCTSRQASKKPEYAFFFGAQEKKLGQSIDNKPLSWSFEKAGKEVIGLMRKNIPGIIEVREALNKAAKRGYIKGLDGRKLFIRKPHAALNTYTQGNGAICCKTAMIKQVQYAKEQGLDAMQVGFYHDETQTDVAPNDAELFGHLAVQAIRDTGTMFNLKVPLDGNSKIGNNWAETH
ncbi:MAG: hypothetical protein H3Z50_08030 [archaeon]|nr:hypothetical protein [archaeon]